MTALLVGLGGAVGATLRFLVGHRLDRDVPVGTFVVNVVGSFLLGLFTAMSLDEQLVALLGTGFCGGLTTYSAFAVQTHALGRRGALYAALTVLVALGACAVGFWVGQA
ncbi:CrcB family protein [Nocardioides sp.]|uniref:fluoride efflux transporter FluC n=1 Tax=Nocardioides sp. TaxID=35761 RepID=UPI002869F4CA|nr:CrcB family protein [Nocardioides sp.]